jgi:hypothetical protein
MDFTWTRNVSLEREKEDRTGILIEAIDSHHYPTVRGGPLVALFFLPAGRISYEAKPDDEQPHCV